MIQVTDSSGWIRLIDPARISLVNRHAAGGMWPEKTRHVIDVWIDIGEPLKIILEFESAEEADVEFARIAAARP